MSLWVWIAVALALVGMVPMLVAGVLGFLRGLIDASIATTERRRQDEVDE